METKALAIRQPVTPQIWAMIKEMAPVMVRAQLFGIRGDDEAAAIMLKGYELGFGITASFEFIDVILGKPALSAKGMLAVIQQSSALKSMDIEYLPNAMKPSRCRVTMERTNGFTHTVEYSVQDAERAGLINKDIWKKYQADMLRWRAVSRCARVVFPDVIGGLYTPEELGSDDAPDSIDAEWSAVEVIQDNGNKRIGPNPDEIIGVLNAQYGYENVLAMFGIGDKDFRPDNLEHLDMVSRLLGEPCSVCGEALGKHPGNKMCEANDD